MSIPDDQSTKHHNLGQVARKAKSAKLSAARMLPHEHHDDRGCGEEGRTRTRIIHITTTALSTATENAGCPPSASSADIPKSNPVNSFAALPLQTVGNDADDGSATPVLTVRANPMELEAGGAADDADANLRAPSPLEKPSWRTRL
jgi:hypothetical protein